MKNPLDDDNYTGNDEQIEDLKELVAKLHHSLSLAHMFLESLPKGWLAKTTGDIGALNDFYCSNPQRLIAIIKE